MAKNYKAAILITGDNTGGVKAIKATRQQIDGLNKSVDKSGKSFKSYTSRTNASTKALTSLKEQAKLAAGAVGLGLLVSKATQAADTMTQLNARLELATDTTAQFQEAQSRLIEISRNTYTAIDTNVTLFARMSIATKDLAIDQETLFRATESLQNSFRAYGTSTEEAASATLQLTQAMAKGKLDGDEFRSVMENAPLVMTALTKELNITKKELFEFSRTGRLQVEDLVAALANSADEFAAQSAKIPQTISEAFTGLNREFTLMVGNADDAISVSTLVTKSINLLANNLELLVTGVGLRLLAPMIGQIGATAILTTKSIGLFGTGLVATNAKAALATKTLSGLSKAMALVGGPAGAILIGGYAAWEGITSLIVNHNEKINEMASLTGDAEKAYNRLNDAIDEGFNETGIEAYSSEIRILQTELDRTIEKLKTVGLEQAKIIANGNKDTAVSQGFDMAMNFVTGRGLVSDEQAMLEARKQNIEQTLLLAEAQQYLSDKLSPLYEQYQKQAEAEEQNAQALSANIELVDKWITSQEEQLVSLQKQNEYFGKSAEQVLLLEAAKQKLLTTDEEQRKKIDALTAAVIKETNALEAKQKAAQKSAAALQNVHSVIEALKGEHRPIQVMFEDLAESLAALNDVPIGPKFTQEDYDEGFDLIQDQAEKLAKDIVDKVKGIYEEIPNMFGDVVDEIEDIELSNIFDGFADGLNPAISALGQFKDEINTISLLTQSGKFTAGQEAFYKTGLTAEFALNSMASMAKEGSDSQAKLAAAAAVTNTILGISAILTQGQGDPWTAIPRMIAMAAMVASTGTQVTTAFGGSGGGAERQQEVQGTGTVLGDDLAKSESMANALDIIAEASEKIVGINSSMLRSLNAMNNAITGTANQIARVGGIGELGTEAGGFGGLSEIFGGTGITSFFDDLIFGSSRVTDRGISVLSGRISEAIDGTLLQSYEVARRSGLFGSSTRTGTAALSEGITNQIGLIFESMQDAVLAGAEALGLNMGDVQNALDSYRIQEQRISLMDLSPEEQQAELEAVFSSIFDGLTEYAIPFITQFQAAGEGLGETLARVSTTVLVFEEAIESMGLEFIAKQVDPELFAQAAVAISDFAGGMDAFIDGYTNYVSNFLSDDQQLEILGERISGIFSDIDLDLPGTRDGFTDLIQSLDLTTAAGQEAFGTLIALSGQMDSYYDGLEESQQRASDAMDRFFANFYSDDELLNRSIGQSSDLLAQQASNIGLDPTMSMAEFRQLFNEQLPNLTDAQIAQWLEFSETLVRVTDLEEQRAAALQAEIEALQEYNDFAGSITDQIAELTGNGASDFENRIAEIDSGLQSNIDSLYELAAAAGLAEPAQEDLSNAYRLAALQTAEAIGLLRDATQSLIDELYGDQAQSQVDEFSNSFQSGISNVSAAGSNLFSQWESALQRIDDYTNSLLTNEQLSPLEAPERLAQARADFYDLVAAANAGDVEAAGQVQPAMQEFLQILRDVERSGEDYNSEFYAAIAAAQGITAPTGGGESVTVGPSQAYIDYTNQQRQEDAAAMAAHRLELSQALAEHVSNLSAAINQPVLQLFTDMGGDIEQFLVDLGIDVGAATGESIAQMAALGNTLDITVTEIGDFIGLQLGSLVDAQSLLNDGLEYTIDQLPDGIQNTLEPLLRDVESAADGTEQEAALAALESATAGLPAEYQNALAPYFDNIDPTSELAQQVTELQDQTRWLTAIAKNTAAQNDAAGLPSYDVGTAFVPKDQIAQIHKGEMIIPAREAGILRGMGVNVVPQSNKEVVEQLKRVEAELKSMKAMQRTKLDESITVQGQIRDEAGKDKNPPAPIQPRQIKGVCSG